MNGTSTSPQRIFTNEENFHSCWGRFKLKLPWRNRRRRNSAGAGGRQCEDGDMGCNVTAIFTSRQPRPFGGFKYDPLSYAQNFDEGSWDDGSEETSRRSFTARYVSSSSPRSGSDK